MLKLITNNFGAKVLALVLSVGLWVFVAASQNTVTKFPGSIPVKAVNTPSELVAIYDTKEVDLKVAADPAVWKQLSSENFSAFVDLNGLTAGTHNLKVIVNANVPNVSVVEVSPSYIMVRLEPIAKKTVNINAQITGQAADGLTAGDITFTPDRVEISGPKSLIDLISSATASIKLNGETDGFSRDVTVAALNDKGEAISDITSEPATVKADVKIVKAGKSKTVGIKVITTGMPASGFYVSSLATDPLTIDIVGQDSIIRPIQYVETTPVDISGLSDNLTKNVTLNLPAGVSLQQNAVQKVKVTVTMAPNSISKEVTATINPINLNSSLKVQSYNPTSVKVVVSGPAATINALTGADVVLNLDLSSKSTGANGIDLTSAMFKVPAGVSVSTFVPSSLTVNIGQ